jgi:hypothetical protein
MCISKYIGLPIARPTVSFLECFSDSLVHLQHIHEGLLHLLLEGAVRDFIFVIFSHHVFGRDKHHALTLF